jgi:hypothetical protein
MDLASIFFLCVAAFGTYVIYKKDGFMGFVWLFLGWIWLWSCVISFVTIPYSLYYILLGDTKEREQFLLEFGILEKYDKSVLLIDISAMLVFVLGYVMLRLCPVEERRKFCALLGLA